MAASQSIVFCAALVSQFRCKMKLVRIIAVITLLLAGVGLIVVWVSGGAAVGQQEAASQAESQEAENEWGNVADFSIAVFDLKAVDQRWKGAVLTTDVADDGNVRWEVIVASTPEYKAGFEIYVHERQLRLERAERQFAAAPLGSVLVCREGEKVEVFPLPADLRWNHRGERRDRREEKVIRALEEVLSGEPGETLEFRVEPLEPVEPASSLSTT